MQSSPCESSCLNGRYLELFQPRLGVTGALNGALTDQLEVCESFNVPAKAKPLFPFFR